MKILSHGLLALSLLLLSHLGFTAPMKIQGTVTVASSLDFVNTTKKILKRLKTSGFQIKTKINHQKIAKSLGHKIPANQAILFGKPSFEYPLISKIPQAALFVPLSMVIWQDKQGKTYVSYWDPKKNIAPLLSLENNKQAMKDLNQMSETLKQITMSL
jgi:uncharacterized protein (DUF302 family)